MEEQNFDYTESGNSLSFKDIYGLCLAKWKWFVVSVVCCMFLATIYLMRTPPVYTRSASILIKDDQQKGGSISSDMNVFSNLGLFNSTTNVYNELSTIKSPTLVMETVRRLHLDINYLQKGSFYDKSLYGKDLPVNVIITGMNDDESCSFALHVDASGKVTLSKCMLNGDNAPGKDEYEGSINQFINTSFGKVMVTRTANYKSGDVDLNIVRSDITSTVEGCQAKLTADLNNKQATIIDMSYQDVSTERAEDFLNTLINVYNESWLKDKNQIAVSTSHFIDERLKVIQKELGSVDNAISSYKSDNLIPDMPAAAGVYLQQASDANAELIQLRNELYIAQYILKFVSSERNHYQLLPANSGIGNATIEKQIAEYDDKVLQRNSLISNSSTNNPLVQDLDKSLASLRASIIASVENQVKALNTQIEGYVSEQSAASSRIASGPTQSKYLLPKERQQKVKEALYLYLLQKREENELSQAFTAYNTRIISAPMGKNSPTSPVRRNIFLMAFLLGLIIPVVIIVLRENLNTTIRGRKDIEDLTVPFVGELPQFGKRKQRKWLEKLGLAKKKKKKEEKPVILVQDKNRNVINEAFRVIRSNVEFMLGDDKQKKVIMMSSMNSGSGKTFVAMNLAACFAIKKKKVAVLDLDLRKASLSHYVGNPRHGVTDYLIDRVDDWHKVIVKPEGYPDLDVIPVGIMPPNPAELLFSQRLDDMIKEMRQEYDIIFFDCPPIDVVADSSVIVKWADLTVFIVRAGLFEREMLPEVEKYYTEKRIPSMSLLLNGTEAVGKGYHRYGYHYGYGYGYGYTSKNK